MSAALWALVGGISGLVVGAALGAAAALALASAMPDPADGTYAMRQMVVCLPLGALAGLVAGGAWGLGH